MSPPRVLLTTYHHAYLKKAGGEFEIFSISEKLKRHGMIADIYGPLSRGLESYDVVLHFSVHGGGLDLLRYIHDQGKPIALWPNLWLNRPANDIGQMVRAYTDLANVVIFKSSAEQTLISSQFELPADKIRRVIAQADPVVGHVERCQEGHGGRGFSLQADLIQDVNRMAASLKELEGARRRWIAPISHELRTPLSLIKSAAETLIDGGREDPAITVVPDLTRRCPAVDPDDHHLFVSLGCATENLIQAALAHGLQGDAQFDTAIVEHLLFDAAYPEIPNQP